MVGRADQPTARPCAVLSGVLREHEATLREVIAAAGLRLAERRREGDWLAVVVASADAEC